MACVEENGKVAVVGEGKAKITAYAVSDPELKAEIEIVTENGGGCSSSLNADLFYPFAALAFAVFVSAFVNGKGKENA